MAKILILGGGFAGINAGMALEKLFSFNKQIEITLISRENFFLFTPLLSEVAIGTVDPRHIVNPVRELFKKVMFHRGEVTEINLKEQTVTVMYDPVSNEPVILSYDHLVLALGSTTNVQLVPGVDKYAFNFKEIGDALLIRNHIIEMFERADTETDQSAKKGMLTFAVIGGGYSGVEIAAGIRDMAYRIAPLYPILSIHDIRIVLIEAQKRILPLLPSDLSSYASQQLEIMGIEIKLGRNLTSVHPHWIELDSKEQIPAWTTIWATGFVPPPVFEKMPIIKDQKGRPIGVSDLRLSGFNNVWAIGDNVLIPCPHKAGFYPATAQIATRQGKHLAKNIWRAIKGRSTKPFRYDQIGEIVVLGERSAVALIMGKKLKGFSAWLLWRMIYLLKLPRWKKKIRIAMDWLLTLFGPMETAQFKFYFREQPCDIEDILCERENVPEQKKYII